jgi:hypothetical protein
MVRNDFETRYSESFVFIAPSGDQSAWCRRSREVYDRAADDRGGSGEVSKIPGI